MRLMLILALVRMRIRSRSRRKIRPFGIFFLGKWVVDMGRQCDEAKSAGRRMKGEMGIRTSTFRLCLSISRCRGQCMLPMAIEAMGQ
jgi:hypothetical protein